VVQLPNGTNSVYSSAYDEKMHPGLGPAAEADLLYVRQLKIPERMREGSDEFIVWDVGLGAAANAIAVLRATRDMARPLRLISFDNTIEPLAFASENADALGYLSGYEVPAEALLSQRQVQFTNGASPVIWQFHLGDFPNLLAGSRRGNAAQTNIRTETRLEPSHVGCDNFASPHAILFDAFSPAKNPAMWTLSLFTDLFRVLDPQRPCNLTTYSRSTMFRVTLLLAGFFVGRGVATGVKEETTVAANTPELIDSPLDRQWLERAQRSSNAEPLQEPAYSQSKLSPSTCEKLFDHAQFSR
jgi:hypothetical protein